ncbi:MAG TPA: competence protein CoiA family protein [Longimicrobium sp.]|jgi:hypothetical protein
MHRFHAKDPSPAVQNAVHPEWVFTLRPDSGELIPSAADLRHRFRRDGKHLLPDLDGPEGRIYELEPVSRWVGVPPAARPEAFCPVCCARVVTKCGEVLRPHYAHSSDTSSCPAGAPESALHLNTKLLIAEALRNAGRLRIRKVCAGAPRRGRTSHCDIPETMDWLHGWDDVLVEYDLPSVRADVILLRQGCPIGAIEVYVTHEVDHAKIETLRTLGVPWVEVRARDVIPEPGTGLPWVAGAPLLVRRTDREAPLPWRCPFHRAEWERMRRQDEAKGTPWRGRAVRLSGWTQGDPYYGGGTRWDSRLVPVLAMRSTGTWPADVWLADATSQEVLSPRVWCDDEEAAKAAVDYALRPENLLDAGSGVTMESPMDWAAPGGFLRPLEEVRYPGRLRPERPGELPRTAPNTSDLRWPYDAAAHEDAVFHPIHGCDADWCDLPTEDWPVRFHSIRGQLWLTTSRSGDEIVVDAFTESLLGWVKVARHEAPAVDAPGETDWSAVLTGMHDVLQDRGGDDLLIYLQGPHSLREAFDYAAEPYMPASRLFGRPTLRQEITSSPSRGEILAELDRGIARLTAWDMLDGAWKVTRRDGYSERAGDWIDRVIDHNPGYSEYGIAFAVPPSADDVTGRLLELERDQRMPRHPYWLCSIDEAERMRERVGVGYTCPVARVADGTLQVMVQNGMQVPLAEFVRSVCEYPKDLVDQKPLRPDAYRFPPGRQRVDVFPSWFLENVGKDVSVLLVGRSANTPMSLPVKRIEALHRLPDATVWAECQIARAGEMPPAEQGPTLFAPSGYSRALVCLSAGRRDERWDVPLVGHLAEGRAEWELTSVPELRGGLIDTCPVLERMRSAGRHTYLALNEYGTLEAVRGARTIKISDAGWCAADVIRNPPAATPEVPGWDVRTGFRIYSRLKELAHWQVIFESDD